MRLHTAVWSLRDADRHDWEPRDGQLVGDVSDERKRTSALPADERIGLVHERPVQMVFGGPDGKTFFIAALVPVRHADALRRSLGGRAHFGAAQEVGVQERAQVL